MRGARAPRTSGLTWAQGHNDPRPPGPAALPRPLCTAVPSRTSRPSGFAQRRRYLRIVLTDSAPAPAGLPFAEAKNKKNKTKTTEINPNRRNKATQSSGPSRGRGSGGLRADPGRRGTAGHRRPNVAQALPGAVAPPAACHRRRLLVAGPGGQMHLGFFAPFFILIFKLCFLFSVGVGGGGQGWRWPWGQRDVPLPGPSPPGDRTVISYKKKKKILIYWRGKKNNKKKKI